MLDCLQSALAKGMRPKEERV